MYSEHEPTGFESSQKSDSITELKQITEPPKFDNKLIAEPIPPSPEQIEHLNRNLETMTGTLSRLMGVSGVRFKLGNNWSTNLNTGEVTLNAQDLIKPDLPDAWNEHGIMHELASHLRTMIREPAAARREREMAQENPAKAFFLNIVTDIQGNKRIMTMLPNMRHETDKLYREYLFPNDDITSEPRHVQLMSALIMQEMSPNRDVTTSPEVTTAIAELRNFEGSGTDAISYITRVNKSLTEEMTSGECVDLSVKVILPVFMNLFEKDAADPDMQGQTGSGHNQPGASGGSEAESAGEGQGEGGQPGQLGDKSGTGGKPGDQFIDSYTEAIGKNHVHSPGSGNEHHDHGHSHEEVLNEIAKEIRQINKQFSQSPEQKMRDQIQAETGRNYMSYMMYIQRLNELDGPIRDMQEFFEAIIDERAVKVRRLSRPQIEGAILDPATLAHTYVDVQTGNAHPPAYQDYEWREREREVTGRFDIYLVVDSSKSMSGEKSKQAADSSLIVMEGLDSFMQMIREREGRDRIKLGLDVRTAMYVFSSNAECIKQLSPDLDRKERLDVYYGVQNNRGSTADFLALEQILAEIRSSGEPLKRQRIILFVADGQSNDPGRLKNVVDQLTQIGCIIIPVGIGDEAKDIRNVFGPSTDMVHDVDALPDHLTNNLKLAIKKQL